MSHSRKVPNKDYLIKELSKNITGFADDVLVGLNWTVVVGPLGLGLAHSPAREVSGCVTLPKSGSYAGRNLVDLADLTNSENLFERSIGFAAINAHHNRFDLDGSEINGLDLIQDHGPQTIIVGQFPGLATRVPDAIIIERNPNNHSYAENVAEKLLPAAREVVITASTLTNGTLVKLLNLINKSFVIFLGPSAPLTPTLLEIGIDAICGFIVQNPDAVLKVVMEGGSVKSLKPHGKFLTIGYN